MHTFVIFILCIAVVKCAHTDSSNQPSSKKISVFSDLCTELLVKIGSYLPCPQKEIGFLSTRMHKIFFDEYPYRSFIAQRFDIPELLESETDRDLAVFSTLNYKKDSMNLFWSIASALLKHDHFSCNRSHLAKYIMRRYKEFDLSENKFNCIFCNVPIIFLESKCYKELAKLLEIDSIGFYSLMNYLNLKDLDLLIRNFDNFNEELFRTLLDSLAFPSSKQKFIILNILTQKTPVDWIISIFEADFDLFEKSLMDLFYQDLSFDFDNESVFVFDYIESLLNELRSRDTDNKRVIFFKDLNSLSFTDSTEFSIKSNFSHDERFEIAIVSALVNKSEIAIEIFKNVRKQRNFIFRAQNHSHGFKLLMILLPVMNQSEVRDLMNELSFFKQFNDYYYIQDARYKPESSELLLDCCVTEVGNYLGLPLDFTYIISDNFKDMDLLSIIIFSKYNNRLLALTTPLLSCQNILSRKRSEEEAHYSSFEIVENISLSAELLENCKKLNLKIKIHPSDFAKLLENSISHLKTVLRMSEFVAVAIPYLKSFKQFRNLEEFLSMNIADIYKNLVKPQFKSSASFELFIEYRLMFLYWLKSEHRTKLLEEDNVNALFLKMLSETVSVEYVRFLNNETKS